MVSKSSDPFNIYDYLIELQEREEDDRDEDESNLHAHLFLFHESAGIYYPKKSTFILSSVLHSKPFLVSIDYHSLLGVFRI
jgi:hypothetical protein